MNCEAQKDLFTTPTTVECETTCTKAINKHKGEEEKEKLLFDYIK
jgi:hypothetical protein